MSFKISQNTINNLKEAGKKKANQLAEEAKTELMKKYRSLISDYYNDYTPKLDEHGQPYYHRTINLYKSYKPYKRNSHDTVYYGGVEISSEKMKDYHSVLDGSIFDAQRLLDKYIFTTTLPSATWHGGDWHGGYGVMAKFSIYEEILSYQDYLIKKYSDENQLV